MTEKNITTKIVVYSYNELAENDKKLVETARQATHNSYAPYSHFNVGAAVRLDNGVVIMGANQENAAFAGICAERSAIYNAGANYPGVHIAEIAIAAYTGGDFVQGPISPCGVCRQALIEFEKNAPHSIRVLLVGRDCVYELASVAALLPLTFSDF
ncbi:MAG: cytidine deaminase [Bacteroidales bacterium]|nr:cytidine deaminase [Bacteroidales bacterium]MDY3911936.1 cytidine deaminase [Sodaliphilus sp.]